MGSHSNEEDKDAQFSLRLPRLLGHLPCSHSFLCYYKEEGLMKKRIHVNQHKIKSNSKTGDREPVITVKTYKSNDYCHEVYVDGPCKIIYSPDKPLPCGAKVWIETESEIICDKTKKDVDNA